MERYDSGHQRTVMHPLKQKALLVFFATAQCLVLYALWPEAKSALQRKICIQQKIAAKKRLNNRLLLTAIFNVRKRQKLKKLLVLTRGKKI